MLRLSSAVVLSIARPVFGHSSSASSALRHFIKMVCDFCCAFSQSLPTVSGWCFMAIFKNDFLAWEYLDSLGMLSVRNGQGACLRGDDSDEKYRHCCCCFVDII